jgi:predicted AAA+ superfamily ATPase
MLNIRRKGLILLEQWRIKKGRKPLVLRGARQVGKTTLVRDFSKSYSQFISLNLELASDKKLFSDDMDVVALMQRLTIRESINPDWENTLLFIDEIQEVPDAIQLLRYFYEQFPELSVIAAGSLLEFALGSVRSFPVGRVEFQYLHPLSFEEYLIALDKKQAIDAMKQLPVPDYAVDELHKQFNFYCLLGGMPEVLARYREDGNVFNIQQIYESIWKSYQNDVEKYGGNKSAKQMIRFVLNNAPASFDQRITFQNFGQSTYRSREIGEAFRQLHDTGLLRLIYPTTDVKTPLLPDYRKSPRMQFLDSGILVHRLGLLAELIGLEDLSDSARGALIPHCVFQERIVIQDYTDASPFFWVREKSQSSAEVDLIIQRGSLIIPVEIKSGSIGKLRSLHAFMDQSPCILAIRLHQGKAAVDEVKTTSGKVYSLLSLPYFLAASLENYIENWRNEDGTSWKLIS